MTSTYTAALYYCCVYHTNSCSNKLVAGARHRYVTQISIFSNPAVAAYLGWMLQQQSLRPKRGLRTRRTKGLRRNCHAVVIVMVSYTRKVIVLRVRIIRTLRTRSYLVRSILSDAGLSYARGKGGKAMQLLLADHCHCCCTLLCGVPMLQQQQ